MKFHDWKGQSLYTLVHVEISQGSIIAKELLWYLVREQLQPGELLGQCLILCQNEER